MYCWGAKKECRKNSENKPQGLYFSKAPFERLIFGGACIWRGDLTEGFFAL